MRGDWIESTPRQTQIFLSCDLAASLTGNNWFGKFPVQLFPTLYVSNPSHSHSYVILEQSIHGGLGIFFFVFFSLLTLVYCPDIQYTWQDMTDLAERETKGNSWWTTGTCMIFRYYWWSCFSCPRRVLWCSPPSLLTSSSCATRLCKRPRDTSCKIQIVRWSNIFFSFFFLSFWSNLPSRSAVAQGQEFYTISCLRRRF